jgi:hypothetical protein
MVNEMGELKDGEVRGWIGANSEVAEGIGALFFKSRLKIKVTNQTYPLLGPTCGNLRTWEKFEKFLRTWSLPLIYCWPFEGRVAVKDRASGVYKLGIVFSG